ncbi:transposase [Halobacteriovorax sp. HLS]|uniref:transposase n=1 Tax=Halobacteriovorax sp. HLS TaxID=2234000 RepID=UPI000FD9328C|nr:transposase [Halobacteriovorax sp. HLS]
MPRRKLIRQNIYPYHVTTRTNNKEWFKIPLCEVWDICKQALVYSLEKEEVIIHSFVLMNNHYHLLISTPNKNIDRFMMYFNQHIGRLIKKNVNIINHKFSNRYSWSIIDKQSYLLNVYRYIYQNPVRAKIVKRIEDYPYSSIYFSSHERKKFNFLPHIEWAIGKNWLEKRYSQDFDSIMRCGLKKSFFQPHQKISTLEKRILSEANITRC